MQWQPKLSGIKSEYILRFLKFHPHPHPPLKYSYIHHCYSKDLILNDFLTTKSACNYHEFKKLTSEHCHSIPVYVSRFGPYCEVNETTMFWRSFRANLQVAGYILSFCFLGLPDLAVFFFYLAWGAWVSYARCCRVWSINASVVEGDNWKRELQQTDKPGKIWCGASCGSIHTSQPSSERFSLSHGQVIFNKGKFSFPRKIKLCS